MAEVGGVMARKTIIRSCEYCQTEFVTREGRFCSTSCSSKGKKNNRRYDGANNPNWKGGVSANRTDGYTRKLNHKARSPEKVIAREMVQAEIRAGRLVRGTCEKCGLENAHAHHDDYTKPLDIRWLCPPHHREHHAQMA